MLSFVAESGDHVTMEIKRYPNKEPIVRLGVVLPGFFGGGADLSKENCEQLREHLDQVIAALEEGTDV